MIPGLPPLKVLETVTMTDDSVISVRLPSSGNIADISGYPSGSRHLVVLVNGERVDTTYAGTATAAETHDVLLRFNGDSGTNYHEQNVRGIASTASAETATGLNNLRGFFVSGTANIYGGGAFLIPHAFNTANHKATLSIGGPSGAAVEAKNGRWANTAAITYLEILGTDEWESGSTFKLCVVDEDYQIDESILDDVGLFEFTDLSAAADGDISVIGYLRTNKSATTEAAQHEINDDTTDANYSTQYLYGAGTSLAAARASDKNIMNIPADNATANVFGPFIASYTQHSLGANDPHITALSGFHELSGGANSITILRSHRRNNVEAITKLDYHPGVASDRFMSGSMMSAYYTPKVLLQRQTVGAGGVAAITFTLSGLTIPTNVKDLRVNWYAALEDGGAGGLFLRMRHNGDTTEGNYERGLLTGSSTTAAVYSSDNSFIGLTTSLDDDGANIFGGGSILIPEYAATDRHKHRLSIGGAAGLTVDVVSSRWKNTAAIATIVIEDTGSQDIAEGSVFELEGIGDLGGWSGTVSGVDDPQAVMGVDKEDIEKVMGVASA